MRYYLISHDFLSLLETYSLAGDISIEEHPAVTRSNAIVVIENNQIVSHADKRWTGPLLNAAC